MDKEKKEKVWCIILLCEIVIWAGFCVWVGVKYPERLKLSQDYKPRKLKINGFGFPQLKR